MKKKLLVVMLACMMVFAFAVPAMAADIPMTHGDMEALVGEISIPAEKDVDDALTQEEAVAYVLLWTGMKEAQLGNYPADWNAMALSAAIVDLDTFDPTAVCTKAEVEEMMANAKVLYDAMHADKKAPLFINGVAQPIFPFTTGAVTEGYDNATSNIIRYFVYVETNYDTDADGKLDLVKALVQVPRAAVEGDYKAATIYEARPYIAGCTWWFNGYHLYGEDGYDIDSMYAQPKARVPSTKEPMDTMEHAKVADSNEWYYYNPMEDIMDYEDLEWYDYYLVRGFAVVECGGLGTRDSEGFETCGSDLEIDAFKCVIEWLHGDRVAYTDKEKNIPIEADWSNGQVGMTGRSYAGTTQFGLATTGVEGLETIVPVAGIASWYDYTNAQGMTTGSLAYTDALAQYCASRYLDEDDYATIAENYGNYLGQLVADQEELNGDYGKHWAIRDYTLNAENINIPALIVHGLYDYNVRPKHFQMMYDSFAEAGIEAKLLLHQDGHVTPAHPGNKWAFDVDGEKYETILNKWFSHYLYDVEDTDILDMADVIVQDDSNPDKWHNYESWTTDDYFKMTVDNVDANSTTTITSDYRSNGYSRYTNFVNGTTECSVMYKEVLDADMTIKGTPSVSFSATTNVDGTTSKTSVSGEVALPGDVDHDEIMGNFGTTGGVSLFAEKDYIESNGDAFKVSAMLVDIAPEGEKFPSVSVGGSYSNKETIAEGGVWLGGGLANWDYVKMYSTDVSYKVITRGWMDLCNPSAGFDSASATYENKVKLANGKYYDYTVYLQPTVYTIEEGHTLALVIYPYDSGRVSTNYDITIKDATVSADIPLQVTPYEDVASDSWAANDIAYVYNRDIMNGVGDMNFAPDATFTRAMLATTLYRMEGSPAVTAENPFTDVEEDTWYTDAVIWAAENGIVKGITKDTFAPNAIATREQFATMMYRYANYLKLDVTTDTNILSYEDAGQISEYAVEAMTWAVDKGLIKGMTETLLVPQGNATRAQAAAILARFDRTF